MAAELVAEVGDVRPQGADAIVLGAGAGGFGGVCGVCVGAARRIRRPRR